MSNCVGDISTEPQSYMVVVNHLELRLRVNFDTGFSELLGFLFQSNSQRFLLRDSLLRRELANVLGNFYAASAFANALA